MLALFFALEHFLGAFCASCCVCSRSWSIFVPLGPLRTRFWKLSGGSGEHFGSLQAIVFEVFACTHACNSKKAREAFCIAKTNTKRMSAIQRATPKTCKFDPEACRTALSVQIVLQTCLGGSLGSVLEGSGPLGNSSWVHLAGFWSLLGDSWPLLGASWAHLGRLSGALKRLLAAKSVLGLDFGRFGRLPGWVLAGFRGTFWHAFRCAPHS